MRGGMPRWFACLLGTLAALCCAAPASAATPRIIGGHPAAEGEYPAQGFLEFNGFVCGGSLVSNRYFLTAGHCATDSRARPPGRRERFPRHARQGRLQRIRGDRQVRRRRQRPQLAIRAVRPHERQDPRPRRRPAPARDAGAAHPGAAAPGRGRRDGAVGGGQDGHRHRLGGRPDQRVRALGRPARGDGADGLGLRLHPGVGLDVPPLDHGMRRRRQDGYLRRRLGRPADGQRRRLPGARRPHLVGRGSLRRARNAQASTRASAPRISTPGCALACRWRG